MAPQQHRTAPSRRSVLGAAAWSVPAVALATASPAYAISGNDEPAAMALLAFAPAPHGTWDDVSAGNGRHYLTATTSVTNTGSESATELAVTVTLPHPYSKKIAKDNGQGGPPLTVTTADWNAGPVIEEGKGNNGVATFTLTSTGSLAAGASASVTWHLLFVGQAAHDLSDAITVHARARGTQISTTFRPTPRRS